MRAYRGRVKTELAETVLIGLMGRHGMPVDRFYGQPMDAVTWTDDPFVHSDPACRTRAEVSPGETHRVRFGAFFAARMCGCCRVEAAPADCGLAGAVVDLVQLCELLKDEAEEVENRQEPDYVSDYLGPNFNRDHWRYLQFRLAETTDGLRAHPWLHNWARPVLERAVAYADRRCEEQQIVIDKATIEQAAISLQQHQRPTAHLTQAWQAWRQRKDWPLETSPDYACYGTNARLRSATSGVTGDRAASVEISVRLPPPGPDWDGWSMVETLSMWETAAIAAYKTTADWAGSVVTLAAPPAVAQELRSRARALDVAPGPSGTPRP
jgi:hypothetical protein